jgi:YfiH family protein
MIRKNQNGVEWLEFELLAEQHGLVHGVFLRHGGVSQGPFATLNVGGATGDDKESIAINRQRILDALEISHYESGKQVHGDQVIWIKEPHQKDVECDGMITNTCELGLMIKHADCQAAIFYDPIQQALANVHSGWRGNVKNIYRGAIHKMKEVFGSKPENLLVGISPSLGPEHAEFKNYKIEFPEYFWKFQIRPEYFDLWAISRHQLEECGVLPHHIEIAGICTYAQKEDYFSYRRDKVTGRNATVAMLKT